MNRAASAMERIAQEGFAVVPDVLAHDEVALLIRLLSQVSDLTSIRTRGSVYAIRNLLDIVPEIRALASSQKVRALVEPILGSSALSVRGLLFDKTQEANWKVPWHQDLSIAVQGRIEVPGFASWSQKAGVVHVQPPIEILERMLAVRIHLDDCGESNGPVRVIPGSHSRGRLTSTDIQRIVTSSASTSCTVETRGVLLMRPLLLHASSAAKTPRHRRVIHLEFASCALPGGLEWYSQPQPDTNC